MPPRVLCPGGDHRPPATGGSCACGMVTRVPSQPDGPRAPGPLVPPEVRDVLARCLYDGPGDPLAPDANNHRLADMRMSAPPAPPGRPGARPAVGRGSRGHRRRRAAAGRLTLRATTPGQSRPASSAGAAAARRSRARSSQCWQSFAELLAALPQRERLLQRQPPGLQPADDVGELLAGLLVGGRRLGGFSGSCRSPRSRCPGRRCGRRARAAGRRRRAPAAVRRR